MSFDSDMFEGAGHPPALRPTELEIASGVVVGEQSGPHLPAAPSGLAPLQALEEAVVRALERSPCLVSFSGGRDSSTVLAVATRVARHLGLPLPIPATIRFPNVPRTDESSWQELVVDHLGLADWIRIDIREELDLLGPVATGVLRRHGVLWPPNVHLPLPLLADARGGSLLTGLDGDGLFGAWPWVRAALIRGRRVPPRLQDVPHVAHSMTPVALRRAWSRRRAPVVLPWLRPEALGVVAGAWADERGGEPTRWDRRVDWFSRRRYHTLGRAAFDVITTEAGVGAVHPLLDGRFLAAVARQGGRHGYGNRTAVMRTLFSGVLPAAVVERPTKAGFADAFWGPASRDFASTWDGHGVDASLVDVPALQAAWASSEPNSRCAPLLQAAWLAAAGGDGREGP